jgi:ribosomal-protein-alanine N-acetyltransferase
MNGLQVRWLIRRDMPEVLAIERESFAVAWTDEDFVSCLRTRNCIGMVAEQDIASPKPIVGFMIYELHKGRLKILNLAVHPGYRRQGIGAAMVGRLIEKLSQQRRNIMHVFLRESNLDAQCFCRSLGFKAVNVVREHYADTGEDAYVMQYRVEATAEV